MAPVPVPFVQGNLAATSATTAELSLIVVSPFIEETSYPDEDDYCSKEKKWYEDIAETFSNHFRISPQGLYQCTGVGG